MTNYREDYEEARRKESLQRPFDYRNEASADARHIVKHIWIVAVVIPACLAILAALLR